MNQVESLEGHIPGCGCLLCAVERQKPKFGAKPPAETTIAKAGRFDVEQIPCRHYLGPISYTAPRAAVLHTTEGSWSASLAEFKVKFAPTFLLGMNDKSKKVEIAQLIPLGQTGASLEHHNELAAVQIEMVGFSQEKLWLPDSDTVDALASLMLAIRDAMGVPLTRVYRDGDFGMYGYQNRHRSMFGKYAGWFGHGDIPNNAHWDPGNLEWSKIFARAAELDKPAAPAKPDPAPKIAGAAPDDCEHCDGAGYKGDETCAHCDGTGLAEIKT